MFKTCPPCPYATNKIKALVKDCPEFKDGKCAFRDIKDVGEFKTKLGQMRDTCKGKRDYTKALEVCCGDSYFDITDQKSSVVSIEDFGEFSPTQIRNRQMIYTQKKCSAVTLTLDVSLCVFNDIC
jgi:hypothetical protein